MTIHSEHPFADPVPDPVRRLRGRLGGTVTLWTAGHGAERAGLTVTSLLVAHGEPPQVLALLDPDSDLCERLLATGRGIVQLLTWEHRDLADAFAGVAPAPGGVFRTGSFTDTDWGPRLDEDLTWVGMEVATTDEVGWSTLVRCRIDHVEIGNEEPLVHRRGRYVPPAR